MSLGVQEKVRVKPLRGRLLVEPEEAESTTSTGIVIPDTAQDKQQRGRVVAVGGDALTEDGKPIPSQVKVDDVVLYAKYAGNEFKLEGSEYLIISEKDVLAVVNK
ncbi:MAG: co-chaperone GroES [Candidatus Dormibacteraceae bacterium]